MYFFFFFMFRSSNHPSSHCRKSMSSDRQSLVTPTSCQSTVQSQPTSCRSLQKQISRDSGGGGGPGVATSNLSVTLDSIITEYLTNQHALCKNPMVTCPQFNLFEWVISNFRMKNVKSLQQKYDFKCKDSILSITRYRPHKCPDPCTKNSSPMNVTVRLARRALGMDGRRLDRRHIYSRFCPVKTFRPTDVGGIAFTCCTFSVNRDLLFQASFYILLYRFVHLSLIVSLNAALHTISHFGHPCWRHQNVQCTYRNGRGDLSVSRVVCVSYGV